MSDFSPLPINAKRDSRDWTGLARRLKELSRSTSTRLLFILIAALLPLALIATYAAQQVTENAIDERTALISDTMEESATRLDRSLDSDIQILMAYGNRIALGEDVGTLCMAAQRRFASLNGPSGALIFTRSDPRQPVCELGALTPGFRQLMRQQFEGTIKLLPENDGILVQRGGEDVQARIVAYYSSDKLLQIADPVDQLPMSELFLSSDNSGTDLQLTTLPERLRRDLDSLISSEADVMGMDMGLYVVKPKASSPEFIALAIPFVMMIAAAILGWWVVNYMLVRPMSQLRHKMTRYRVGETLQPISGHPLYATEIKELDNVFQELTYGVAQDKKAIEDSLKQQVALTREVHHRVKNNLQIVASLISLHARTAETPTAAHAYASIQRRVEALSVVHRNHHADGEENKGIDLRALINEVINSFRTSDVGSAFARNAQVNIDNLNVSQDVAMPVAFLLTEILELLQISRSCQDLSISIQTCDAKGKSKLVIQSAALMENVEFDMLMADGIDRVVTGLSRQLRSQLIRDRENGTMQIDIEVRATDDEV